MAVPKSIAKILTANRLRTGDTVYYTATGAWSPYVTDARIATAEADVEALKRAGAEAGADNAVIDVNIVDVEPGAAARPVHIREIIRASGPTVRPDLQKPDTAARR